MFNQFFIIASKHKSIMFNSILTKSIMSIAKPNTHNVAGQVQITAERCILIIIWHVSNRFIYDGKYMEKKTLYNTHFKI